MPNYIKRPEVLSDSNGKLIRFIENVDRYFLLLSERQIPQDLANQITLMVNALNEEHYNSERVFKKRLTKTAYQISRMVEKECKLVPLKFYEQQWMVMGMAIFGSTLGVVLGVVLKNMGLIGIGIPIGMLIGIGIGRNMDQEAFKEGRQLDVDLSCR